MSPWRRPRGVLDNVRAYLTEESALDAEKNWLRENRIYPHIPPVMGWASTLLSYLDQAFFRGRQLLLYHGINGRAVTIAFV
jgi:hypothetical protein